MPPRATPSKPKNSIRSFFILNKFSRTYTRQKHKKTQQTIWPYLILPVNKNPDKIEKTKYSMIAIFDSGFGGLTVLKPIIDELPDYDYLYLGDNARAPYGNHSPETIKRYCEEAVEYLFENGATLIIFACNTASSIALRHIQQKYLNGTDERDRKILGVLIPVSQEVAKNKESKRIGLIGTRATVSTSAYDDEIKKINPGLTLHKIECPLLVPLIEEDWHKKPEAVMILKKYLRPLKNANIDSLILGCTHYPLMYESISKKMGRNVKVLDSGKITAKSLKDYLSRHPEIESKLSKNSSRTYLTTDLPDKMKEFIKKNFDLKVDKVKKIELKRKN
ncbi:glutamate racemase [Candidatus Peregrinibacteria bacterium]|nr:glutamate racemase [Candidatus Peregrinibacteria bacterium]